MKNLLNPAVAIMMLIVTSCGNNNAAPKNIPADTESNKTKVTVAKAEKRDVDQVNTFTATVEAEIVNNIAPQNAMRIKTIYVEVGDHVKKGQKLVDMDDATLVQAKVQMENNKIEFERVDQLYSVGGTSKSDWDTKKLAYDISVTNYDNLAENTTLTAPISGIVSARNYDNGDMYSTSKPICVVEQIHPVKMKVNISETLFSKIRKGMEVNITLDVYEEESFTGKITLIYPTIDPVTRTFPVEITIDNANERVRPGMFARVSLNHGVKNRVVIPDRAINKQTGAGDRYVYVIEDGVARYSKIELGRRIDTEYEIISGVNDGEMVVVTGQTRLNNGSEVEIVN